eukprot:CAMPEP_0116882482 /NCGR_PEP_ID=MMETSP0463-20121206/14725_1 /TAXON_ID=181622 /ORGANISM="Strombidinopsis sp, Strain SopsisLIS2011" /LENGTH=69 /DNA_ID=CAMNT_0004535733 /DNA_START=89 /DNA_END=298 /DNA_ORIENTATION=-
MTDSAKEIVDSDKTTGSMAAEMIVKRCEIDAQRNWDIFYKNNSTNGYKDRHYLSREFTELADALEKANK